MSIRDGQRISECPRAEDRMPMRTLGRSLLESWAHTGAICGRWPRTQPVPYICLLVIRECKGLRPIAERAVVDRKARTWPPACRAHRPAPARAPDPVRGQVDRAAREHCSSVRPPKAGMRPGPRAPHPARAPTPSQRCWIVPTNWAIPSFHLTLTTTPRTKYRSPIQARGSPTSCAPTTTTTRCFRAPDSSRGATIV
jgi:hypothetical protein